MAERDSDRLLDAIVRPVEGAERIEPGAEAVHRDDLAREVARHWLSARRSLTVGRNEYVVSDELAASLDRLAAAYGYGEP